MPGEDDMSNSSPHQVFSIAHKLPQVILQSLDVGCLMWQQNKAHQLCIRQLCAR